MGSADVLILATPGPNWLMVPAEVVGVVVLVSSRAGRVSAAVSKESTLEKVIHPRLLSPSSRFLALCRFRMQPPVNSSNRRDAAVTQTPNASPTLSSVLLTDRTPQIARPISWHP
jgi:hypothetical protein